MPSAHNPPGFSRRQLLQALGSGLALGASALPSVWAQLPDQRAFLAHLKQKAGLPANHWSLTLKLERYTVQEF